MRASAAVLQHASRQQTFAFVGLGAMGRPMAANLISKLHKSAGSKASEQPAFVLYDTFDDAVSKFISDASSQHPGLNIKPASSPAGVAKLASTIVSALASVRFAAHAPAMLPSSPQVQSVYLDEEVGILAGLEEIGKSAAEGTLCIDCTTLDQSIAKSVSARMAEAGASMIDAPVSGGTVGAEAATLSFMVGAPPEAFARAQPLLALMGKRAIHCGESGLGIAAKLANNQLLGASMLATAEAMLLGTRLGLAPELLADIINSSTGRCWSSEVNNPTPGALAGKASPPADRGYKGGFVSRLMYKDLQLAAAAAEQTGLRLPSAVITNRIYEKLAEDPTLKDLDFSSVFSYLDNQLPPGQEGSS